MTVYHPTSCTECEALKLGDCSTCEMSKWRTVQNLLAWIIALETMAALSFAVFYAIWTGSATDSLVMYGDPFYAAKWGASATFVGLVLLFAFRDPITAWILYWAPKIQEWQREQQERGPFNLDDDEEDEGEDED